MVDLGGYIIILMNHNGKVKLYGQSHNKIPHDTLFLYFCIAHVLLIAERYVQYDVESVILTLP